MKQCIRCKEIKSINDFYKCGGFYHSYCKECSNSRPLTIWQKKAKSISSRCSSKKRSYGKKGIKNLITPNQIKELWFRDKAWLLKEPSIDRIDSSQNYTFENCRFIELRKNIALRWRTKYPTPIYVGREKEYMREYAKKRRLEKRGELCTN